MGIDIANLGIGRVYITAVKHCADTGEDIDLGVIVDTKEGLGDIDSIELRADDETEVK